MVYKARSEKNILEESGWYLNQVFNVKQPVDWEVIIEDNNQFVDKKNIITGEPEIVFVNFKTSQAIIVNKIPSLCLNNIPKTYEENEVRILSVLVADTILKKTGLQLKEVFGYILYADFQKIRTIIHSNNAVVVRASAQKALKELHKKRIASSKLTFFMNQNPLMLVSNNRIPDDFDYFT